MSEGLVVEAVVIFILILFNGFFSSAEIAIISAKRSAIDKLAKEGNRGAAIVARMKEHPEPFLATVQVGVTVVATLASVIGGVAAVGALKPAIDSLLSAIPYGPLQGMAHYVSVGVVVVVISYATLVVGELVPKSLALRSAERIACFSARPLDLMARVSYLVVKILTASTAVVLRGMGIKKRAERVFVSEEEIKYFIKEGWESGIFEETEAELLHGIFEFADTTVREVMVPKHRFSAIEVNTTPEKTLKFISETGFSRYPVYRGTYEKVVGVIFNKDVFRAMERGEPIIIRDLMRPPYFVPNSILISGLLREMQRRKVHMAIVVDEHGDVDGLVTIEDILEEIVGEIEDEYDARKGGLVERLKDGTLIVDASVSLRDLEDFGVEIEEDTEEYHTLAGFMLSKLQRVPRGGEFVEQGGMRFTVVDVDVNRIVKVKVEFIKKPAPKEEKT
ncbi:MAG: hemolysin family protein [Thermodesulfobacteriota bacterium]